MADSNLPKQDFAPPWLKFPTADSTKSPSQKLNNYQSERNRQRREDPYHQRPDFNRLHRQTSLDFHDAKRYPPGQGKYRHHSVEEEYYGYPYSYAGYYAPSYGYEKYGMQYGSQPALGRTGSRDGKYPHGHSAQGTQRRGYYDRDHPRDSDGKSREKSERDRPFSDDFPSLVGTGEPAAEVKQSKPASGVWENPPKSNRNDESPDLLKNNSSGIYKALVPSKNGQLKKNSREGGVRMNGSVRDSSPLSPSNKSNKEGMRQSPTTDLAIVTQPKKLGDKKSEFLRALRNESSVRNGDGGYQDLNQNAVEKKQCVKDGDEQPMKEEVSNYRHMNGNHPTGQEERNENVVMNGSVNGDLQKPVNGDSNLNGEALISDVDHINLSGEEEEKRLLLSMGWVEEDNTEYVITDDEIREFQHLLQTRSYNRNGLKSTLRNALDLKLDNCVANGLLNGVHAEGQENNKNKPL